MTLNVLIRQLLPNNSFKLENNFNKITSIFFIVALINIEIVQLSQR